MSICWALSFSISFNPTKQRPVKSRNAQTTGRPWQHVLMPIEHETYVLLIQASHQVSGVISKDARALTLRLPPAPSFHTPQNIHQLALPHSIIAYSERETNREHMTNAQKLGGGKKRFRHSYFDRVLKPTIGIVLVHGGITSNSSSLKDTPRVPLRHTRG